jgi:hypothetical protein
VCQARAGLPMGGKATSLAQLPSQQSCKARVEPRRKRSIWVVVIGVELGDHESREPGAPYKYRVVKFYDPLIQQSLAQQIGSVAYRGTFWHGFPSLGCFGSLTGGTLRARGVPIAMCHNWTTGASSMFAFFSSRLGCIGSLIVSVVATVLLLLILGVFR